MQRKSAEKYVREAVAFKVDAIIKGIPATLPSKRITPFDRFPARLFKYMAVKKYNFEALENEYVYLCPAKDLDDQFECRANLPIYGDGSIEKGVVNKAFENYIINFIEDYPPGFSKADLRQLLECCLDSERRMDLGKVKLKLGEVNPNLSDDEKGEAIKAFGALASGSWMSKTNEEFFKDLVLKAMRAKEEIGIGSLTENGKSQVMWEMYGDHYQGFCVEYDFDHDPNILINAFPVIYGDKSESKLLYILVGMCMDVFLANYSKTKNPPVDGTLDYIKLFLTKYAEWSFQKEWRIIGEAKDHFPVKIKNIYLGKRIGLKEEKRILSIAKSKGFQVFKQKDNYTTLALEYEQITI